VPGRADVKPNADVTTLIQAAFAMEREGQPQVTELQAGVRYAVFDVGQITPAAPAACRSAREGAGRSYHVAGLRRGQGRFRQAARRAGPQDRAGRCSKGSGRCAARGGVSSHPRQQLTAMQGKVPATLSLMFAMAQGTAKRLEVPGKGGWLVVVLNRVTPGKAAPGDPLVAQARSELGQIAGREYVDQLRAAVREAVGVKRNETAIAALRTQLLGGQ